MKSLPTRVDELHRITGDVEPRLRILQAAAVEDGFFLAKVETVGQLLDRELELSCIDGIGVELDLALHGEWLMNFEVTSPSKSSRHRYTPCLESKN
jgi:hypothetical protein